MSSKPYLPQILSVNQGKQYQVEWDYQEYPESGVLFEREQYLTGFIEGFVTALNIPESDIVCLSSFTGTIKNLSKNNAEKVQVMLENMLVPLAEKRHESIKKDRPK